MKKLVSVFVAAAAMLVACGCKTVPTVETMTSASTAIGYSAGLVANMTRIDDQSRNAVVDIVGIVGVAVPDEGQRFEDAWMPLARAHVAKLVAEGRIDAAQGEVVLAAFRVAVLGLDYIFEVRYPKARENKELVTAAVRGFGGGFLAAFRPVNLMAAKFARSGGDKYDRDALEYLMRQLDL